MDNFLVNYFKTEYNNNRMSHAFLICNTFYAYIRNDLEYILSNYFFDGDNCEENPDIYIIKPTDKILKDDILKLKESFKSYSLTHKNKVYIIDGVEKMNSYAANALLKFLEEPESNIYAILITSNISKVISTIKSRCQLLMIDNKNIFDIKNIESNFFEKALAIVKLYETHSYDCISYIYDNLDKKIEKEDLKIIIKIVKYFYRDCLDYLLFDRLDLFESYKYIADVVIKKNDESMLVNKLMVLMKEENKLEYNLNTNLFLDNLLIELEKISNG